jgi:TatD DNase family protein
MNRFFADSHCHLYMAENPTGWLERARAIGVTRLLVPGTTLEDSARAVAIAQEYEGVFAAVGIHPHEAKDFDADRDGTRIEELARQAKVVAIGEVGLDFYYDHSPRPKQIEVLEWMLDLARRVSLPAILHNRESGKEMLEILSRLRRRERPGVFHSFTESADFGARAIDLGYRISFSGMLTFRAAENIREAARGLPLEAMLIETDAPFLAPVPHRGKTNEPSFVIETAKKLAELKAVDLEIIAETTTLNFESLFEAVTRSAAATS